MIKKVHEPTKDIDEVVGTMSKIFSSIESILPLFLMVRKMYYFHRPKNLAYSSILKLGLCRIRLSQGEETQGIMHPRGGNVILWLSLLLKVDSRYLTKYRLVKDVKDFTYHIIYEESHHLWLKQRPTRHL